MLCTNLSDRIQTQKRCYNRGKFRSMLVCSSPRAALRQKWIKAIPRKDWTVTVYIRVCAKHFTHSDFMEDSCDTNSTRRNKCKIQKISRSRLNPGVVPHIFRNLSEYLSSPSPKTRSTKSSASAKRDMENSLVESSINHLFQLEKIETLASLKERSLLQQHGLQSILRLNTPDQRLTTGVLQSQDDCEWLVSFVSPNCAPLNSITTEEADVIYFVSGYIGRSISGRRKCMDCKKLLITDHDVPDLDFIFPEEYKRILRMADRGGLAKPTKLCFAITALAVKYFTIISNSIDMKKKLFCCQNQRFVFMKAAHDVVYSSSLMRPLLNTCSGCGHTNFDFIVQSAFNCFARNELKQLNSKPSLVEPPAKNLRKIRKLTSKASKD